LPIFEDDIGIKAEWNNPYKYLTQVTANWLHLKSLDPSLTMAWVGGWLAKAGGRDRLEISAGIRR